MATPKKKPVKKAAAKSAARASRGTATAARPARPAATRTGSRQQVQWVQAFVVIFTALCILFAALAFYRYH